MYEQIERLLIACLTVTAFKLGLILAFALDPDPTSESENGFGDQGVYVDFERYIVNTLRLAVAIRPSYISRVIRVMNLYGLFKLFIFIVFLLRTMKY